MKRRPGGRRDDAVCARVQQTDRQTMLKAVVLIVLARASADVPACHNSCEFAFDDICDDGGMQSSFALCTWDTDCQDCKGPRPAVNPHCSNVCQHSQDNQCDDGGPSSAYAECTLGSDCQDCGPGNRPHHHWGCEYSCAFHRDGSCDDGGRGSEYEECVCGRRIKLSTSALRCLCSLPWHLRCLCKRPVCVFDLSGDRRDLEPTVLTAGHDSTTVWWNATPLMASARLLTTWPVGRARAMTRASTHRMAVVTMGVWGASSMSV